MQKGYESLSSGRKRWSPNSYSVNQSGKLARQRLADQEQAEERRKQALEDRRLQNAIARAEKAREAAERKELRLQCVWCCRSSAHMRRLSKLLRTCSRRPNRKQKEYHERLKA